MIAAPETAYLDNAIRPVTNATVNDLLSVINTYTCGWRYSRPITPALLANWSKLGEAFQPAKIQLIYRDDYPQAMAHGELHDDTYYVHLLAVMPGAVEDAVILLERIEQEARLAGAARLCGPCWRAGSFYGGYLLGSEPYHPHWAIDGTAAYVQAGWRISHPAVLLRMSLYTTLDQRPLPDTYRIEEVDAPAEFDARTMRVLATLGGEEAATCTARIFPNLRGAHGGTVGQIGYVGTAESHRGKGLAKALVSHSLRRLHDWGASEALIATGLDNEPALRAYEAVGFQRFANLNEWSKALSG